MMEDKNYRRDLVSLILNNFCFGEPKRSFSSTDLLLLFISPLILLCSFNYFGTERTENEMMTVCRIEH